MEMGCIMPFIRGHHAIQLGYIMPSKRRQRYNKLVMLSNAGKRKKTIILARTFFGILEIAIAECLTRQAFSGSHQKIHPAKTFRFRGWFTVYAGRAPEWHSGGQRFDPAILHQGNPHSVRLCGFYLICSTCNDTPVAGRSSPSVKPRKTV